MCAACRFENPVGARFCAGCGARIALACPACGAEHAPGFRFCPQCGAALAASAAAPAGTPAAGAPPAAAPAGGPGSVTTPPGSAAPAAGIAAPPPSVPAPQIAAPPSAPSSAAAPAPLAAAPGGTKEAVYRAQEAKVAEYTPRHLAEKILTSRAAVEGERKAVTVLFADVAGFTPLASRLSPEDVHEVMDGCFERLSEAVHRLEGTINQFTGDGVMALFGAPIAHEDHAERGVSAALAIQAAMARYGADLERERGVDFQMRVGLHSGTVVVGRIGDNLRMDYTAQGDTVNLAARLEQAAVPGRILVSEATRRLAETAFTFTASPPLVLKGRDEPVTAYEVGGRRDRRARVELLAERGLTPLVGRDRELAQLRDAFARAAAGRGEVVGVMGEAGTGKSRLLYELRRECVAAGAMYVEGRCISYGQSIPLLPIVEMLRRGFSLDEGLAEETVRDTVTRRFGALGADERHLPFILHLLGADGGHPAVQGLTAEARRRYTFEALRALTLASSGRRPIVFAVEDLHWVDPLSQDFLRYLAEHSTRSRVLLLATYRPGHVPPWHDKSYASQIALAPLAEDEAERVITAVLGVAAVPDEVRRLLLQKAEGNPFYLEEVTRSFVDAGILTRANEGYRLVRPVTAQDVPDTVQGVVMARLDRLGDERKRTIQTAAVVGREFALRLLRQVSDMRERLEDSLADLKTLELIYEKDLYPELEYVFKHALVQDVAYGSLLKPRRRLLHEMVARAIEELYADRLDEHVADLAHHYRNGDVWDKAYEFSRRAGDHARAIFANREAIHHYTECLAAGARMIPPPPAAERLAIHETRGLVWHLLSNYDAAVADFEAMQAAAREAGDRIKEAEALCNQATSHWWRFSDAHKGLVERCAREADLIAEETGDERIRARVLFSLGMVDQKAGLLREADQKFLRSVEICRRRGLAGPLVTNLTWLGAHASWRGEMEDARRYCEEAERRAQEIHEGFYELVAASFHVNIRATLGEWDRAFALVESVRQRGRDRENKYAVARATNTLGFFHHELGDFRGAIELNREGIELGQAARITNNEIYARINLADDYLGLEELGTARHLLEEAAERLRTGHFDSHLWKWSMRVNLGFARLWLSEGDPARAAGFLDEAMAVAERTESRKQLAEGLRLRGELALAAGRLEDGLAQLREALNVAQALQCPRAVWEAAAALARGLLPARLGAGARGLLLESRESEARAAYATALEALGAVLPRIPQPALRETLLGSPVVARLREEARRLGVSA